MKIRSLPLLFSVLLLSLLAFAKPLRAAEKIEQSVTPAVTAIPDNSPSGLSSQTTVTAPGKYVADLRLEVDIHHSYSGDLRIALQGPDGTTVLLYDRTGGSADDVQATFGGATFTPESLLAFNGKGLDGVWTLTVSDNEALDTGTLDGWRIEATTYEAGGSALATGRFLYEDLPVTTTGYASPVDRPVRRAELQVVRSADGLVLGSGLTADDGSYSSVVASDGTTEVYVRVLCKALSERSAAAVLDNLTNQSVYAVVGATTSRDTASTMAFGDLTATRSAGVAGPFNILDQGVSCGERVFEVTGAAPPLAIYLWDSTGANGSTGYLPSSGVIVIQSDSTDPDEFDDDVITHETGHFYADRYSVDKSPGGAHHPSEAHQHIQLAWSEGWAYFWSCAVKGVPDQFDYKPTGVSTFEIETPTDEGSARGQDTENSVQAVLWDLYDTPATADDSPGSDDDLVAFDDGLTRIWAVFDAFSSADDCTLETFRNRWTSLYGDDLYGTGSSVWEPGLRAVHESFSVFYDRAWSFAATTELPLAVASSASSPSNQQRTISVNVDGDLTLSDVNVFVSVPDPNGTSFPQNLRVYLRHPDGTEVLLHNRTTPVLEGGVLFDWYQQHETEPYAWPGGALAGKLANGTWALRIENTSTTASGTLDEWRLDLKGRPGRANLRIESVSAPSVAAHGGVISVSTQWKNTGDQAAGGSFHIRYYLSSDPAVTTDELWPLGSEVVSGASGGDTGTQGVNLTVPSGIPEGAWYLGAIIDSDGEIAEAREDDNGGVDLGPLVISGAAPGIDLIVAQVSAPSIATVGTSMPAQATLYNGGATASGHFVWSYYLSQDADIQTDDVFLASYELELLGGTSSHVHDAQLPVPADLPTGAWYLGVIVDVDEEVGELVESNNQGHDGGVVTVGAQVESIDLVPTNLVGPPNGYPGGPLALSRSIQNVGATSSPGFSVAYWLSVDTVFDEASDCYLGSEGLASLTTGQIDTASVNLSIPSSLTAGTYYLAMSVDSTRAVTEAVETNNLLFDDAGMQLSQQNLADLVLTSLVGPSETTTGSAVTVTYQVANTGIHDAPNFRVACYLSTDAVFDGGDLLLGDNLEAAVAAGGGFSQTRSFLIPTDLSIDPTTGTTYWLAIHVDSQDFVAETNESNNAGVVAGGLRVAPPSDRPDLKPKSLSGPLTATISSNITLQLEIENLGRVAAAGGAGQLHRFYLSADSVLDPASDTFLGAVAGETILGQGSLSRNYGFTVPSIGAGDYHLAVWVDADDAVLELDDTNNVLVTDETLEIVGSATAGVDLVVSSLQLPAEATLGMPMPFTVTFSNLGQTAATANVTNRFYLSPDASFGNGNDTAIDMYSTMSGLGAGGSASFPLQGVVPTGLSSGAYHLIAVVDADGAQPEDVEDNNWAPSVETVLITSAPLAADLQVSILDGPTLAPRGDVMEVYAVVANGGLTTATGPFVLHYVLSEDSTIDTSDTTLADFLYMGDVGPLSAVSTTTTVPIPMDLDEGNYTLGLWVDWSDWISEAREDNNTGSDLQSIFVQATTTGPDLVPEFFWTYGEEWVRIGRHLSVQRTIKNTGQADVSATFFTDSFLIPYGSLGPEYYLGRDTTHGLEAGAQDVQAQTYYISTDVPPGDYHIAWHTDATELVVEGSGHPWSEYELNNWARSLDEYVLHVVGQPDLRPTALSITGAATVGQSVTITRSITNQGHEAPVYEAVNRYFLSMDQQLSTDDLLLAVDEVAPLAPGATDSASFSVTLSRFLAPGNYYLGIIVDAVDTVSEELETNNSLMAALPITVSAAPDLYAESVSWSATTGTAGTPITVTASVRNVGAATAAAFEVSYYLSSDAVWSAGDVLMNTVPWGGLEAGRRQRDVRIFAIPAAPVGDYHVVMVIDPLSNVETDSTSASNQRASATAFTLSGADVTGPTATFLWSEGSDVLDPEAIPGDIRATVWVFFDEPLSATPQLSIDRPPAVGIDVGPSPMLIVGNTSTWRYDYLVPEADGVTIFDGLHTMYVDNVVDGQGNGSSLITTFFVDSVGPMIDVSSPLPSAVTTDIATAPASFFLTGTVLESSAFEVEITTVGAGLPAAHLTSSPSFSYPLELPDDSVQTWILRGWDRAAIDPHSASDPHVSFVTVKVALDEDGDGMPSFWEKRWPFLDHTVPGEGGNDDDGDGLTNLQEWQLGTNPAVPDNTFPTAVAGLDRSIAPQRVTLNGTGSYSSPPGGLLNYLWTYEAGPAADVIFDDATSPTPSWYATTASTPGEPYVFQLVVTDPVSGKVSLPDLLSYQVDLVAPIAHPGYPALLPLGSALALDGTRSAEANDEGLFYFWDEDSGNPAASTLSATGVSQPMFTPTSEGVYQFHLDVDNGLPSTVETLWMVVAAPGKIPPRADAGADRVAKPNTQIVLDGRGSADGDGDLSQYYWEVVEGPSGTSLIDYGTPRARLLATQPGLYRLRLEVTDGGGRLGRPDDAWVFVDPRGAIPTAVAGADQLVTLGGTVALDGGASSSPDGSPLAYAWTQIRGPRAALVGALGATPLFSPARSGTYVFALQVSDGTGMVSSTDTVNVWVQGGTARPTAVARILSGDGDGDGRVATGATIVLDASLSTGAPASFFWEQTAGPWVPLSSPTSVSPSFVSTLPARLGFRLHARNMDQEHSTDLWVLVDGPGATLPTASAGADQSAAAGQKVTLDGRGSSDPEGNPLGYQWSQVSGPRVALVGADGATPSFVPVLPGTYVFELVVHDGTGTSLPDRVNVFVGGSVGAVSGGGGGGCSLNAEGRVAFFDVFIWLLPLALLRRRR